MADVKESKPSSFRLLVLAPSTKIISPTEELSKSDQAPQSSIRSVFSPFLTGLTGSAPSEDLTTFAGYTSHSPLCIRNKYYSADVTLWCDELPHPSMFSHEQGESDLEQWTQQMLSAEAKEAREVIGGIILVLSYADIPEITAVTQRAQVEEYMKYIKAANELRDLIEDECGRDLTTVVVVQDMTPKAAAVRKADREEVASTTSFAETLEETCVSEYGIFGWDVVAWRPETESSKVNTEVVETSAGLPYDRTDQRRNEYGEQVGMARIVEVLEQTNWSASIVEAENEEGYGLLSTDDIVDSDDDSSVPGYKPKFTPPSNGDKDIVAQQSDEFQREIMGLHFALEEQIQQQTGDEPDKGDDLQVEQLAGLMDRIIATKEAAVDMSKEDREKFARREVSKIMHEMRWHEQL